MEKFSAEHFFDHELTLSQPEKGYRFSMDPFCLARHIQTTGAKKMIDVGCGCGIISLLLAKRYPDLEIIGVEIQKELVDFSRKNIRANHFQNTIRIIHDDIKKVKPRDTSGKADIIVSNPPYKKKNSGRLNPDPQKAIARHEITLDIDGFFKCSKRLLKEQGQVYIIFPAERISDLLLTLGRHKFCPDHLRFVHTKKNQPASRVILCAVKNSKRSCIVQAPVYIHAS